MIQLLQSTAEINQTMDQLTKSSLELAEATANLGALKVIFGVFMVFMLLVLIMFVYQIISMSNKINNIQNATDIVTKFFNGASDRALGKQQSEIMIRRSFANLSNTLKYQVLRIRIENHIEREEATKMKVESVVKSEFDQMRTFLSTFRYHGDPISKVMQSEDVAVVSQFILEQVYISKDLFTVSSMDQSVSLFLEGIKLDYISRI